ncbi:hypothetical protein LNAT_P0295 [Lebetimonas natsushimae]|uniref:Mor transcription activator domain-containing protein n=1 Tax=Lebetimonas natsushimae TaxID=1936991 RepID=A0A292YC66_9BACT|nr:hypothetical protein [Lebetimonas natsushimae]GAX87000.1 hypothetical protein LNAT_P0295 [Lebetimonas natsushimae]
MVIDVTLDYLIGNLEELGIKESDIYLLLERLEGFRIYVNKQTIQHYRINKRYLQLKSHLPGKEIIKLLAREFNKSEHSIRKYIKRLEAETEQKQN